MAQCQATTRRYPAPRLRDHATHEESSLEHESVYKFMIMTSLFHISVTYRVLLSFQCCPPPPPLFPASVCAFPTYTPTFHALCFLPFAALYVVRAQRYDDPILHLYSTVRDSLQSRGARVPRSVLPNQQDRRDATRWAAATRPPVYRSETRKRVTVRVRAKRAGGACALLSSPPFFVV